MDSRTTVDANTATRWWFRHRMDTEVALSAHRFLRRITEDLSIASGDGAALRVLSTDDRWLLGVTAHHPDRQIQAAMVTAMHATAQPAESGLWRPVFDQGLTVVYRTTRRAVPEGATPEQAAFIRTYPATRIMVGPVGHDGRRLGGVSLVRFVVDRDFTATDEALLQDVAVQAARAIEFGGLSDLTSLPA